MSALIEVVSDAIEIHNVGPEILQKIPTLVRRAITKLRRMNVIPPKIWNVVAGDVVEEYRDKDNNLLFKFISLPTDFYRLDELSVFGDNAPYLYVDNINSIIYPKTGDQRKYFTVYDININNDLPTKKVLAFAPYPDVSKEISVRYYYKVNDDYDNIPEDYWEAIINQVENILGLKTEMQAEKQAIELFTEQSTQKGHNSRNKTFTRTKGTFFKGRSRRSWS